MLWERLMEALREEKIESKHGSLKQRTTVALAVWVCVSVGAMLTPATPGIAAEGPERFTLDTGYRSTTAGPIAVTRDGRVLWITGAPSGEARKGMFQISRDELRASRDSGRTWGAPRT